MKKLLLFLLCLFLSACYEESVNIDIQWKIDPGEIIKYSAVISEIKPETRFKLDGFEVLNNSTLKNKMGLNSIVI